MSAIGMVEVFGLTKAITVADECLKTSNVSLVGIEKVSSGILTVKIIGDVGAITSAINAVENFEQIISTSVIPNLDDNVLKFFKDNSTNIFKKVFDEKEKNEKTSLIEVENNTHIEENKTLEQAKIKIPEEDTQEIEIQDKQEEKSEENYKEKNNSTNYDGLEKKTVKELIQIITKTQKITYKEAKKLKKEQLLKILKNN